VQGNVIIILMGILAGHQIPNILHGKLLYVGTNLRGGKQGTEVAHITTTEILVP